MVTPPAPSSAHPSAPLSPVDTKQDTPAIVRSCILALGGDRAHSDTVSAAVWKSDGTGVVTGSMDMTVKVWGMTAGVLEQTLAGM